MDADNEHPFPSVSIRVYPWFLFSMPDCGLRIDLHGTARLSSRDFPRKIEYRLDRVSPYLCPRNPKSTVATAFRPLSDRSVIVFPSAPGSMAATRSNPVGMAATPMI